MDLVQQEFNMRVALVCIAKNEDDYIEEWINYHLKLGFSKIYIYENNWRCSVKNDNIVKIPYDGEVAQTWAYNDFIQKYRNNFDWVGFLDVDEFLCLKQDNNVIDFLSRFNEYSGVGVNWYLFGNNNHTKKQVGLGVLERFTKRQKYADQHIKSFINLNKVNNFSMLVHNPSLAIVNQEFNYFSGPFCKDCKTHLAQINHYFVKSFEEFKLKVERGRADTTQKRSLNEFDGHNFNDVEDFTALNFYKDDNNNILNT
jgi:hypothetical protein